MRNKHMSDEQERMANDAMSDCLTQDEFTGRLITQAMLDELHARMDNERFWVSLPKHIGGY